MNDTPEDKSIFGVLNMAGNVAELTGPPHCTPGFPKCWPEVTVRGGSWIDELVPPPIADTRQAHDGESPKWHIGFRCVVPDEASKH